MGLHDFFDNAGRMLGRETRVPVSESHELSTAAQQCPGCGREPETGHQCGKQRACHPRAPAAGRVGRAAPAMTVSDSVKGDNGPAGKPLHAVLPHLRRLSGRPDTRGVATAVPARGHPLLPGPPSPARHCCPEATAKGTGSRPGACEGAGPPALECVSRGRRVAHRANYRVPDSQGRRPGTAWLRGTA